MNLVSCVSLPRRIASWCMAALSSIGFILCGLSCGQAAVHSLKPVPLDRAGFALLPLAVKPAGNFRRVLVRNGHYAFAF